MRWPLAMCVAGIVALTTAARAQGEAAHRVLIVTSARDASGGESLETIRLRRELQALGFEVVTLETAHEEPRTIDELTRSNGAAAAIRVVKDGPRVDVWLRDRVTGKTVVREVDVAEQDAERAAAVLAVRAVELLRASLLEVNEPHPTRGEVEPDPVVEAWVRPPEQLTSKTVLPSASAPPDEIREQRSKDSQLGPRWGVDAGPAIAWSPGGAPAALVIDVGARVMIVPWAGICVRADLPASAGQIEEPEGTADVRAGMVLVGARAEPLAHLDVPVRPFAETGVGFAWVSVSGRSAQSGYVTLEDQAFSAAPFVRLGVRLPIVGPLALRADAGVAVAIPPVDVSFAGRGVVDVGLPWVTAGGGADLYF